MLMKKHTHTHTRACVCVCVCVCVCGERLMNTLENNRNKTNLVVAQCSCLNCKSLNTWAKKPETVPGISVVFYEKHTMNYGA